MSGKRGSPGQQCFCQAGELLLPSFVVPSDRFNANVANKNVCPILSPGTSAARAALATNEGAFFTATAVTISRLILRTIAFRRALVACAFVCVCHVGFLVVDIPTGHMAAVPTLNVCYERDS